MGRCPASAGPRALGCRRSGLSLVVQVLHPWLRRRVRLDSAVFWCLFGNFVLLVLTEFYTPRVGYYA